MRSPSAAAAATILTYSITASGCGLGTPTRPPADAFVRGQAQRIIAGSMDSVWPKVFAALEDEGVTIHTFDRKRGIIACRPIRTASGRHDLLRQLKEIAHVEAPRGRLRRISEYSVEYTLFLAPVDAGTSLKIVAGINATDRSQMILLTPGIPQVIPVRVSLPSKGVAERQLLHRIAAVLFSAEEMLYYIDLLGYD